MSCVIVEDAIWACFFNLVVRENSMRGLDSVPAVPSSHSTVQTLLTTCLDCGCLPPFKPFHSNSLDSGCRLWCHRLVSLCEAWERLTTTRLDHFAIPGDALVEPSVMVASSRAHTRGTPLVSARWVFNFLPLPRIPSLFNLNNNYTCGDCCPFFCCPVWFASMIDQADKPIRRFDWPYHMPYDFLD